MRIKSLKSRIVLFFLTLLAVILGLVFLLVDASNRQIAREELAQELSVAERVFTRLIEQNTQQLSQAAKILAADFGFREAIATNDLATLDSVLANHGARISADMLMLADLGETLTASTLKTSQQGSAFPFPELVTQARKNGTASAIVLMDGTPYQLVLVPVLAPLPVAYVAIGFVVDDVMAETLRKLTGVNVSFLASEANGDWQLKASTLPIEAAQSLPLHLAGHGSMKLEHHETLLSVLAEGASYRIAAVLQTPLSEALEPYRQLRTTLLVLAIGSMLFALVFSVVIALRVTQPVNLLAESARRIREGEYGEKVEVQSEDEIGELASSFNHMREAISKRERQVLNLAYRDPVTNLPNRALFNKRLDKAIEAARISGSPLTVLMMDLDRFKFVNDTLGHDAGDSVLREVGDRIKRMMRESDTLARLGGDEFAIVLPNTSLAQVEPVVLKIMKTMEEPLVMEEQPLDVGSSIGIAAFPDHGDDATTLIRYADVAMYAAKRSNSGYAIYNPSHDQHRREHLSLLGELRRAITNNELVLHYQPKANFKYGRAAQAEALLRWNHPHRGAVSPAEFIPFAEQTGYIRVLTRWVIETALRQCGIWRAAGMTITVSINISTRDLMNPMLPELVSEAIIRNRIPASSVCLEITETGIMEDPARAAQILMKLHAIGVALSIDDYGAGHSSLGYLKKLPIKELKIDRSFVQDMARDKDNATIVRSTIELGHNMGLMVVAEGVEDEASWNLLKEMGCDQAQGYYFSRPLSTEQFEKWIEARAERSITETAFLAFPLAATAI